MTLAEVRKQIHVMSFSHHSEGCLIDYVFNKRHYTLLLDGERLFNELVYLGSIEEDIPLEELADYKLSQWDAINLVIRQEYENAVNEEINNSDIGKAIDKLK